MGVQVPRQAAPLNYEEPPLAVFLVFLFYVLCFYLQIGYRVPVLGAMRIEFLVGAVLGPLAISVFFGRKIRDVGNIMSWAVALLLCMGFMVAFSRYPAESWYVYLNRGLKFAVFGFCIAAFVSSPRTLVWFLGAFLLAFLKMGQEGFLGTLDGSMIWENQGVPRLRGSTPNYNHPNSFSGTQLGTLPFVVYLLPLAPWYLRVVLLIQGLFCGNVVLHTASRTGYLGLVGGGIAMVSLAKRRLRVAIILVAITVLSLPLIPGGYLERFESIFTDDSRPGEDTSIGQRKQILLDALAVFIRYPLGIGVGAFPYVRNEIFGRTQDTHNLYLEVATNLGIQGLIIFTGFIIALWVTLRRLQKDFEGQLEKLEPLERAETATRKGKTSPLSRHVADLKLFLATARATWVFLIIRLVLGLFGMDMYEIYWWFCSGLAISLLSMNRVARSRTEHYLARAADARAQG